MPQQMSAVEHSVGKGAIDVRNAFNPHFNGPAAATPSQNQQVYCAECAL